MVFTEYLINFVVNIIFFLGYPGLIFLMALESMIFPLPSELVMPFAGYLVASGKFNLYLALISSTLGSLLGSLLSYYIGKHFGHIFVIKYGNYFLLNKEHLLWTEDWFKKYGEKTIFISRLIPVVRHLISIPAGIGKMNLLKFIFYTITGAAIWNGFLLYAGILLQKNWERLYDYFKPLDYLIIGLGIAFIIWFIHRHFKGSRK